jgi:hypothetical protein
LTALMADPLRNNNSPRRHWQRQFPGEIGTCVDARLGSSWISSHSNIRAPTAALEADALAGLLCGRPRDSVARSVMGTMSVDFMVMGRLSSILPKES